MEHSRSWRRDHRWARRTARLLVAVVAVTAWPVLAADDEVLASLRALKIQRDGAPATVGDLLDESRPAVIAMWASYCIMCRHETPVLKEARSRWKADGLRVATIVADVDDPDTAARLRDESHADFDFHPIQANQEDAAEALAPDGFPANFLVDGTRVTRIDRLLTADDVAAFMRKRSR